MSSEIVRQPLAFEGGKITVHTPEDLYLLEMAENYIGLNDGTDIVPRVDRQNLPHTFTDIQHSKSLIKGLGRLAGQEVNDLEFSEISEDYVRELAEAAFTNLLRLPDDPA